jgi:aminoglycoside 6'-N-acetyltransferase
VPARGPDRVRGFAEPLEVLLGFAAVRAMWLLPQNDVVGEIDSRVDRIRGSAHLNTTRPTLQGDRVTLRGAVSSDSTRFREIIETPEVKQWWREYNIDLDTLDATTGATAFGEYIFAVVVDDVVIGLVQYLEETEPDYRSASLDIAIHPDWHGRGLGGEALRLLIGFLFTTCDHHRITIDPAVENESAKKAYRAVGFKPVGVMRQAELGLDGTWNDALLMDLLRDEWR